MTAQHAVPDPGLAAERGLAVFPLPPGSKKAEPGWPDTVVTGTPGQVRAAWPAGANVGVSCRASKLAALDLDGPEGIARFEALCARWGQKPPTTLTIRTPHTGRHVLLRMPPRLVVRSASGEKSRLGPGIDIRGPGLRVGGYLVGLGSVTEDGVYEVEADAPIAPMPAWIAALIGRRIR